MFRRMCDPSFAGWLQVASCKLSFKVLKFACGHIKHGRQNAYMKLISWVAAMFHLHILVMTSLNFARRKVGERENSCRANSQRLDMCIARPHLSWRFHAWLAQLLSFVCSFVLFAWLAGVGHLVGW